MEFKYEKWLVKYTPTDGGRLDRLSFDGTDLLTTAPEHFKAPKSDYGRYENRPVYGYDDCFPSVAECKYPEQDWLVPDHGEVCWLPWKVTQELNTLTFKVESKALPLVLTRELIFEKKSLSWEFELHNEGNEVLPVQHIIHPLMPLQNITDLRIPEFTSVFDRTSNQELDNHQADGLVSYLLNQPQGTAKMLFLQQIVKGKLDIKYNDDFWLKMTFPQDLFPTLGIWWNNKGYPNEEGLARVECAFEPVSGSNSSLAESHTEGSCMYIAGGEKLSWSIVWELGITD